MNRSYLNRISGKETFPKAFLRNSVSVYLKCLEEERIQIQIQSRKSGWDQQIQIRLADPSHVPS